MTRTRCITVRMLPRIDWSTDFDRPRVLKSAKIGQTSALRGLEIREFGQGFWTFWVLKSAKFGRSHRGVAQVLQDLSNCIAFIQLGPFVTLHPGPESASSYTLAHPQSLSHKIFDPPRTSLHISCYLISLGDFPRVA